MLFSGSSSFDALRAPGSIFDVLPVAVLLHLTSCGLPGIYMYAMRAYPFGVVS